MRANEVFYACTERLFKGRVKPNRMTENVARPFMVYTESAEPENTIDGGFTGENKVRLQAWIFADDYDEVKKLCDAVIRVMELQTDLESCSVAGQQYQYEDQTQSHLVVVDFVMWESTT